MSIEIDDINIKDANKYYGRKIVKATIDKEGINLGLDSGNTIRIYDGGQACCEERYVSTDDNIEDLVGYVLTNIEVKDGPEIEDSYDVHEQQFVEIQTTGGFITLVTHNEHNGYYGGFSLYINETVGV